MTRRITMLTVGLIALGLGTLVSMLAFARFCDKV